jgi:hypothetical protein
MRSSVLEGCALWMGESHVILPAQQETNYFHHLKLILYPSFSQADKCSMGIVVWLLSDNIYIHLK